MKNFKLIPALFTLSLALLFSVNSPVVASTCCVSCEFASNYCDSCECCNCPFDCDEIYNNYYSPDNYFVAYKSINSDLVFVKSFAQSRVIFTFENLVSFSFSKDSRYLLVERSEYSTKFNAQNNFIEIFDLANENRIFYMPFIRKSYPSTSFYATKTCFVGDINLNFYEDTLETISFDYASIPVYFYGVKSVYMSPVCIGLSVKFNDSSVNFYLPKKDFSGLSLVARFNKNILASDMICTYID